MKKKIFNIYVKGNAKGIEYVLDRHSLCDSTILQSKKIKDIAEKIFLNYMGDEKIIIKSSVENQTRAFRTKYEITLENNEITYKRPLKNKECKTLMEKLSKLIK